MVSITDYNKIPDLLSEIIFYGFSHGYSSSTIEERIISNKFILELENGNSSFLNNFTDEKIVESIYGVSVEKDELLKTNTISLWLGEVYSNIFFKFNKSFSFIFLYLPLSLAERLFDVYHEMDFSQIRIYFQEQMEKDSLLSLLLKKRNMSVRELSVLSGISFNTLKNFTRNNDMIYKAKFETIYKICQILNVNINVFIEHINNYSNSEMYEFDQTNIKFRSILAINYLSYFSRDINVDDYYFDVNENVIKGNDTILKVLWTSIKVDPSYSKESNVEIIDLVNKEANDIPYDSRKNQILVIYEYNQISETTKPYLYLYDLGFYKIVIINNDNVLCICKRPWVGYLNHTIKNTLMSKAKKEVGGDFAL